MHGSVFVHLKKDAGRTYKKLKLTASGKQH